MLIVVAIASKVVGSGLGAWWGGLPRGEVLMTSGPLVAGQLPPHTAAWLV